MNYVIPIVNYVINTVFVTLNFTTIYKGGSNENKRRLFR